MSIKSLDRGSIMVSFLYTMNYLLFKKKNIHCNKQQSHNYLSAVLLLVFSMVFYFMKMKTKTLFLSPVLNLGISQNVPQKSLVFL